MRISKKPLAIIASLILYLASVSVHAAVIPVVHGQVGAGWELIQSVPPTPSPAIDTFTMTIDNNTGFDWADYHFNVIATPGATAVAPFVFLTPEIIGIGALTNFTMSAINGGGVVGGDKAVVFTGLVAAGGSFDIDLDVQSDISYTLYGRPSTDGLGDPNAFPNADMVPIPGAVWLFGSGLMALLGMARKRKQ